MSRVIEFPGRQCESHSGDGPRASREAPASSRPMAPARALSSARAGDLDFLVSECGPMRAELVEGSRGHRILVITEAGRTVCVVHCPMQAINLAEQLAAMPPGVAGAAMWMLRHGVNLGAYGLAHGDC